MKSAFKFSLALVLTFSLSSCGGGKSGNNNNQSWTNTSSTTNVTTGNTATPIGNTTTPVPDYCIGGGEIKHGYQLPPCPDKELNDSTLLGIDTNKNGVRDDVEVWIYNTYDTYKNCTKTKEVVTDENDLTYFIVHTNCTNEDIPYHQIVREIAMQWARAYQIVIQDPTKARETTKYEDNAHDCEWYFREDADSYEDPILIHDNYGTYKELDKIQFNTIKRARAYGEYNFYLSGGAYSSTPFDERRSKCDFNVDKLLGK
ncbi:MAG: hypothetical protein LBT96_03010 [Campylobacteraceae bacterium]|nr:hypothetical protein [Campylobacteraceae bacterium]